MFHIINFNPRSHERSDLQDGQRTNKLRNFNPRSHERSDTGKVLQDMDLLISIHAPTRGATINSLWKKPKARLFQSTLPREERPELKSELEVRGLFQSTLPREERQIRLKSGRSLQRFQSTLPREERQQYCTKNLFIFIQYRQ